MNAPTDKNVQGIILMVLAMAFFGVADALVKVSAAFLSPAQVLFFLNGGIVNLQCLRLLRKWDGLQVAA